jgi:hypothetical protein
MIFSFHYKEGLGLINLMHCFFQMSANKIKIDRVEVMGHGEHDKSDQGGT